MKKADAFARKRKTRDKANLRWVKSRHLVVPGFLLFAFAGAVMAGTLGEAMGVNIAGASIFGIFVAMALGGPYLIKRLTE